MKWLRFAGVGTASLSGVLLSGVVSAQTFTGSIPEPVRACVPSQHPRAQIESVELVANTRYDNKDWYLLRLYSDARPSRLPANERISYRHVVSTAGGRCTTEYSNPMGDADYPVSRAVPEAVANQFSLIEFQSIINEIGREAFERRIQTAVETEFEFPREEIWALEQLGISVEESKDE